MANQVTVNGSTYRDDAHPTQGMDNGGYRKRLLPMIGDAIIDMAGKVADASASKTAAQSAKTDAETAAQQAAISAQTAALGPSAQATSTTSLTIGTGAKSLTIQTGKTLSATMFVLIGNGSNWMHGQISSYNSGTGALVVDVTTYSGAGTFAAWTVSVSAPKFDSVPAITGADGKLLGVEGGSRTWTDKLGRGLQANHNLLLNPTFADGLKGWNISSGSWSAAPVAIDGGPGAAIASTAGAGSAVLIAAECRAQPGSYTLAADINAALQVGGTAFVDLQFYDAADTLLLDSTQTTVAAGTAGWQTTLLTVTAPANTAKCRVRCVLDSATAASSTQFRRLKLEAGSTATVFNDSRPGGSYPFKRIAGGASYSCSTLDGPFLFTGSAASLVLPTSLDDGWEFSIVNNGATDNFINRNGHNIMGVAENLTLNIPYAAITLKYDAVTNNLLLV